MNEDGAVELLAHLMQVAQEKTGEERIAFKRAAPDGYTMTDELTDLKIGASEARIETKIARIEGKIDILAQSIQSLGQKVDAARTESSSNSKWIIGTIIATGLAIVAIVLGTFAYGTSSFYNGTVVRDIVQSQIQSNSQKQKQP